MSGCPGTDHGAGFRRASPGALCPRNATGWAAWRYPEKTARGMRFAPLTVLGACWFSSVVQRQLEKTLATITIER